MKNIVLAKKKIHLFSQRRPRNSAPFSKRHGFGLPQWPHILITNWENKVIIPWNPSLCFITFSSGVHKNYLSGICAEKLLVHWCWNLARARSLGRQIFPFCESPDTTSLCHHHIIAPSLLSSSHHITTSACLRHIIDHHNTSFHINMKSRSHIFNINSCNCCVLCMKCHFHFIQSVCMSCCHLELHLFLVTFFKRVSFTRFKDYRKCCNHIINLSSVQFRECENCWLWIATAPNSFAQVGTPGPRSLATPYSVQIFNSTQSVEGFFSRVTLEER